MPIGTVEFISTVTKVRLREFYEAHYIPENLSLICVVEHSTAQTCVDFQQFQAQVDHAFSVANLRRIGSSVPDATDFLHSF